MNALTKYIRTYPKLYAKLLRCKWLLESWTTYNFKYYLRTSTRKHRVISDIQLFEKRVFSQNGEDGIIECIFNKIGTTNKYFVEFGVQDGSECNTRLLYERKGWTGLLMDAGNYSHPLIKKEFIDAENIELLFTKYGVPNDFDLLSIDIDFNDYWVWKAITNFRPRVVVLEYNASAGIERSLAVPYDAKRYWDKTNFFGASLKAFSELGKEKNYTLVGCDSKGVNAFFIANECLGNHFKIKGLKELYVEPGYGIKKNGIYIGHPESDEQMISV